MQIQICGTQASRKFRRTRSDSWMHDVIALLDAAIGHLHHEQAAHGAILEATSLLRRQMRTCQRFVRGGTAQRSALFALL